MARDRQPFNFQHAWQLLEIGIRDYEAEFAEGRECPMADAVLVRSLGYSRGEEVAPEHYWIRRALDYLTAGNVIAACRVMSIRGCTELRRVNDLPLSPREEWLKAMHKLLADLKEIEGDD